MKIIVLGLIGSFWAIVCDGVDVLTDIQMSQINANVPEEAQFKLLLGRDLHTYFCKGVSAPRCTVQFNLLRKGATQSGVAYPKYYLWANVLTDGKTQLEGAARVAAIDMARFDVIDFMSASDIRSAPDKVRTIFPSMLVPAITERAEK